MLSLIQLLQQSQDLVDPNSGGFSVPSSGNADIHNGNNGSASYLVHCD